LFALVGLLVGGSDSTFLGDGVVMVLPVRSLEVFLLKAFALLPDAALCGSFGSLNGRVNLLIHSR
jgi:hypothetical protein